MANGQSMGSQPERLIPYQIESVGRACRLMRILQREGRLPLFELAKIAGLSRPTAFRLVATLQANGIILKDTDRKYRLADGLLPVRRYKIGYVTETAETSFYRAVTHGLLESAAQSGVEIVIFDSQSSPEIAIANTERLLAENIDLIVEFQSYAQVASVISAQASSRNVPVICVDIPHPNAIYFGVDNCQAGLMAGRYLAHWAEQHWKGQVDEILLVGSRRAGSLPEARLTGSLLGIHEVLPSSANAKFTMLDGNWDLDASREAVRRHLDKSTSSRILVSAIFDPSALGALEAFREADRLPDCAIIGQNGSIEARLEMRRPNSRLLGSVAYFPERYGQQLIELALRILAQRHPVLRTVFIKHQLLTPSNLKQYYGSEKRVTRRSSAS